MKTTNPSPTQLARAYALTAHAREQMERKPLHALRLAEMAYAATPEPLPMAKRALADAFCRLGYANNGYFYKHLVPPQDGAVQYFPSSKLFLSTSTNGHSTVWSIQGEPLARFQARIGRLSGGLHLFADGKRLLGWEYPDEHQNGHDNGRVRIWEQSGRLLLDWSELPYLRGVLVCSNEEKILTWPEHSGPGQARNLQGEMLAELHHPGGIFAAQRLAESGRLLTRGKDNTARIWDGEGNLFATLEGHADAINGAYLVNGGKRLLTLSADGTARTWAFSGQPIAKIRCCPPGIFYGEVLPDREHFMAWCHQEGTVNIWKIGGSRATSFLASSSTLTHACLLGDGQRLFTWSQAEGTARLWDINGTLLYEAQGLQSAKATEDGGHFWLRTSSAAVELRDAEGRKMRCPAEPLHQGDGSWVSPGAKQLLTWRQGESPKIWRACPHLLKLETAENLRRASFLPDGQRLLTLPHKGTPKIWSPEGKLLLEFKAPEPYCKGIWRLPRQQRYLAWYRSGMANLFDEAGNLLRTIGKKRTGRKRMFSSKPAQLWAQEGHLFSDERRLLLWYLDGQARLWDTDGQLLASIDGLKSDLRGARVIADEQRTVAWAVNGASGIWNLEGEPVGRIRKKVLDVQVIGGGSRLLALCYDGIPRICDAQGKIVKRLKGHPAKVVAARVFPDGQRFLTWAADGSARIWDSKGKALARLEGHSSPIKGAAILSASHRIFTWSGDGALRVWSDDGALVATLDYPHGQIDRYKVFGKGRHLMGWNKEGVIRIWDEEGRLLEQLNASGGEIVSAHISVDGERVLTFSGGEEVKVWPLPAIIYEWLQGDPVDGLGEGEIGGYEGELGRPQKRH